MSNSRAVNGNLGASCDRILNSSRKCGQIWSEFGRFSGECLKIKQIRVKQMRRTRIHQAAKYLLPTPGMIGFPTVQQRLDLLPLQSILAATQVAGDDRIIHGLGKFLAIGLCHMRKRAIDEQVTLFVEKFWRHGCQARSMKQVHKKRLEDIIPVMAQNNRRTALFACNAI